jgi:hypothetical protein
VFERRKTTNCLGCALALVFCLGLTVRAEAQAAPAAPPQAPTAAPAAAPDWKAYSYPSDGFIASFPSEPQLQKRDVSTAKGSFELRSYIAEIEPVAIFVGVCDYGAAAAGEAPDTMLQGAKDGALKNSSSHLTREKQITLGIYKGLEFEAESDSAHFYARIYVVGDTLYQTLVVYPIDKPYTDTVRFLDSFQLIARVRN